MSWLPLAIIAWLALLIASLIRSRASGSEKAVLGKYPPGARFRLFLPGSRNALFRAEDASAMQGIRRRSLQSFAVAALFPLLLIGLLRSGPFGGPAGVEEQRALIPPATGPADQTPGGQAEPRGDSVQPGVTEDFALGSEAVDKPRTVTAEPYVPAPGVPETLEESRTPTRLYGTAKVRPFYGPDEQVSGLRIMRVAPGSFWERIGARNEDVIVEFNGQLVDSPQALVNLMNELSRGEELRFRVKGRKNIERFLEFNAPESP